MQKFKIASSAKKADKDRIDNGDDWETDPDFEVCFRFYCVFIQTLNI